MFDKIRKNVQSAKTIAKTTEKVTDTVEKAKTHLDTHKEAYISGASCLTAGVILGATMFRVPMGKQIAKQTVIAVKAGNVTQNVTQIQMLARRGHPGNVIRCVDTGEVFGSINRAAAATGVSPSSVRSVISGARNSVKGLRFEKLGDAAELGLKTL